MSWFSVRTALIVGLVGVFILILVAMIQMRHPSASSVKVPALNMSVVKQSLILDPTTTIRKTPPTTAEVTPQQMYSTFVTQYELGPDPRWGWALQALIRLNMRWNQQAAPSYSLGEVTFDDQTTFFPLEKNGQVIAKLEIPTYADFPEGLAMLKKAAAAMGWQLTGVKTEGRGDDLEARLITWRDRFYSMDPRGIIRALINLEDVRVMSATYTLNPKLWATASVGYTMLGLSLAPDIMEYSDTCYSQALAYLALGKHLDPALPTVREESFLAMALGYKAHARSLLEKQTFASEDIYSSVIMAYLLGDVAGLRQLHEKNPVPLSYCLLGRLYRYMELWADATSLSEQFLNAEPRSYAAMIATINNGDLVLGHALTVAYPLEILTRMKNEVSADKGLEGHSTWIEIAKAISGEESESDFSFHYFDNLLEQWTPWGTNIKSGLIIDPSRIKDIYRALFNDAVYLRFNFLLNRWSVPEKAAAFLQSLEKVDMNHPLVLWMRMKVANNLEDRASVDRLCVNIIQHSKTTGKMSVDALYKLSSYLDKVKYAPQVIRKLTGEPEYMYQAGLTFSEILHFDLAVKMFRKSVERDPFDFEGYRQLAYKQGDTSAVVEAIHKYSYNYKIMKEAGDYLAEQTDPKLLDKALECYDLAMAIVPSEQSLTLDKATVLRRLKRYEEAITLLKAWLAKFENKDMYTLTYKEALAMNYLKLNDPKAALEVLTPEVVNSYRAGNMLKAAWAYDALHEDAEAEDIFQKVVERYPTSDGVVADRIKYLWRHQRDQEAVDLIVKARPRHGDNNYWWYFAAVRKELGNASKERVLKIVDALMAGGASITEISGLAKQCFKKDPELQFEIISKIPVTMPMLMLEKYSKMYMALKDWQGAAAANQFIDQNIPLQAIGPFTTVLYKDGLYELLLHKTQEMNNFKPFEREFTWLEKVMSWEAMGRQPVELSNEIAEHYKIQSNDYYNTLARFLLGQVKLDELLGLIATAKQRCEFAYYIGFSKRLAMKYEEAANWYFICLETQLINNGEMHWAFDELFWWGHAGTLHRSRLMRDDMEYVNQKKLAEEQFNQ